MRRRFLRLLPCYERPTTTELRSEVFRPVEANGRTIVSWAGILPHTPYCRHYLAIVDIRSNSPRARYGEPEPFRAESHFNVEVVMGYRYAFDAKVFRLLYRAQYDWRLPSRTLDEVAESIAIGLAVELKRARTAEKLITYNEDWYLTIEAVYRLELREALNEFGVTLLQFRNSPEFYRRQYRFV